MLDIAGGVLIAALILGIIGLGIAAMGSTMPQGSGAVILVGLILAACVIFHAPLGEYITSLQAPAGTPVK